MWNLENGTDEPISRAGMRRDVENGHVDTGVGRGGWDELGD